jgi:hypothetical protein
MFNEAFIHGNNCDIGIGRTLARSANVSGLNTLIHNNGPLCCDPPFNTCKGENLCPEMYCDMIESFVENKLSLIRNAFSHLAYEHNMFPGTPRFCETRRVVNDINFAYDCAGLTRPIIQASPIDNISDPDYFDDQMQKTWNDGISRFIPTEVIDLYFEYFPEDLAEPACPTSTSGTYCSSCVSSNQTCADYYFSGGSPRNNLYFESCKMIDNAGSQNDAPDITLVQTRMYMFYLSILYIDAGFTGLSMGGQWLWGADDANNEKSYKLMGVIRDYAKSNCTFVIMSSEPDFRSPDHESPKLGNTDCLLFDFDARPARPREIAEDEHGNPISGDGDTCTAPFPQDLIDDYMNGPCGSDSLPAMINECTLWEFAGRTGGCGPYHVVYTDVDCYHEQVPFLVDWDCCGVGGVEEHSDSPQGEPSDGPSSLTWGYNDQTWFSQLSDDCKEWWFNYFYCYISSLSDGIGFLALPYQLNRKRTVNGQDFEGRFNAVKESPELLNAFANSLEVDMSYSYTITPECDDDYSVSEFCNGNPVPQPYDWCYLVRDKRYKITINHNDCSSQYSMHIKAPSGKWLPMILGDCGYIYPEENGLYQIGIRQENMGLPPSTYGSSQIGPDLVPLEPECCEIAFGPNCLSDPLVNDPTGQELSIYPNPSTGAFRITGSNISSTDIMLSTSTGKRLNADVTQTGPEEILVRINNTSVNGLVIVSVRTGENSISHFKLIVQQDQGRAIEP